MNPIGILLNRDVLLRIVRGRPTFERADLYVKAAESLGVPLVFFDASGIDLRTHRVTGYVPLPTGVLTRAVVPLPRVIHNRALYPRGKEPLLFLQRLADEGIYMFNPPMTLNKYKVHQLLESNEALHPHLPKVALLHPRTFPWYQRLLLQKGELFVKPCHGSLGLGIVRIKRVRQGRWRYDSLTYSRVTTLHETWKLLGGGRARRLFFMQEAIPLAKDQGRRFDLRVPVQMDGTGHWTIPGLVARRADRHPFLTNLARGGRALEGRATLARAFQSKGLEVDAVIEGIKKVAMVIADTLRAHKPTFVDFGLDLGLDDRAHPYLIEVNRRDLRITLARSGQQEAYAAVYANPIAYAAHILKGA